MVPLTVIVPTCNRPEQLACCLERLAPGAQTLPAERYEVLVTDDGHDAPAQAMLAERFPWARWTAGPGRGPGANRNHGAAQAQGEWLVFVDDDCLPEATWLAAHATAITQVESDRMVAIQGATIREQTPPSLLWEAPHDPHGHGKITANFSIRRADYQQLGGIDERYTVAFEDIEFFTRLVAAGGEFRSLPAAVVYHPLRPCPSSRRLSRRWEGRVVYAFDQGAPATTIAWRLPWHVLRVIQSRFRSVRWNVSNLQATVLFLGEWLWVLAATPGWVYKWSRQPRSEFWQQQVALSGPPPKYGF